RPVPVFYAIWRDPYMTVGRDTYVHDVLALCGAANVFADASARYPAVTLDDVAARHPAVILLPDEPFRFRAVHRRDFAAFADVPARRLDLRLAMPSDLASGLGRNSMTYDEGVGGWVARHRRLLSIDDVTNDPRPVARDWFVARGFVSILIVPVIADDALLGV